MDAQLSNNLSRGLGAVATTVGQYAIAAHEERIQAAKEQFQQMLSDKKEAAEDARDDANEAQKAKDHAAETELAREQHAQDKAQQQQQFDESKSQQDRQFAESRIQEAQHLAIEQEEADNLAKNSGADKAMTHQQQLDHVDKYVYAWGKQASADQARVTKMQADKMYEAGDPSAVKAAKVAQAQADISAAYYQSYLQVQTKMAGDNGILLPSGATPSTPAAGAAGVSVAKDAKGNFYKVGSDGSKTPITIQQAKDIYNQNKSGATPSPASPSPVAPQPDESSPTDDSDDQSSATDNTSADSYAAAQPAAPPQPTVPPDPTNATPPIGQPDPNAPQLAS
jgi:hypothetical protein